jgi:hypothetical protein
VFTVNGTDTVWKMSNMFELCCNSFPCFFRGKWHYNRSQFFPYNITNIQYNLSNSTKSQPVAQANTSERIPCHQIPDTKRTVLFLTLNISFLGNKAKETWEKLRRCFCNARNRRREETNSDMASKKKSFWKYDEQMSFLIPFLDTRK